MTDFAGPERNEMIVAFYIVLGLSLLLCVISLIPLIRHDHWIFRVFEFPRAQKWVLNLIFLTALVFTGFFVSNPLFWAGLGALILNQAYLSYQIYPFTVLSRKQLVGNNDADNPRIRLVIANVYQDNRKGDLLLLRISEYPADVLLFVEADDWWKEFLTWSIGRDYPHQVLNPMDNTYGMLLFSKYALEDTEVRHLVCDDIPSIRTTVRHPEAGRIRLLCVHPEPPVPTENPQSTERDGEILLIGKEAKAEKIPVIVAGDLNDVAWSYSTELFLKTSGLMDPRKGRGMYSTFHAGYWFFRWPLDHVFCSTHFTLNRICCLPYVGSDHFPIYVDFAVMQEQGNGNEKEEVTADDRERAEEKIEEAVDR